MKTLTGWLVYRKQDAVRNQHYIPFYEQACAKRGAKILLRYYEDFSAEHASGGRSLFYEGEPVSAPDFVVMRADEPAFSFQLEQMGYPVFNCAEFSLIANDKARTLQIAEAAGIPVPETLLAAKETAMASSEKLGFPLVMKPRDGHGGRDVFWIASPEQLRESLLTYHHESFLLQKPVSDLGKDLRVYVVGKDIVAAMLRSREDDFRSNYCLGGNASVYALSETERELVEKTVNLFPASYAGFDFMFHEGNLVLNEIEDVVGARMLYHLTELDIVDLYVAYILKAIAPAS